MKASVKIGLVILFLVSLVPILFFSSAVLGAIIADGVKTGVNTVTHPGRKIWPGKQTPVGQIVKYDITNE